MTYDIAAIRRAFPLLTRTIGSSPLAYLDSAATSQKPEIVLEAMDLFLKTDNANINRGVHPLAEAATVAYDRSRASVAAYIGARQQEIIFTKNATEAINLVARSLGDTLEAGDVVALTTMEHHSNIVPWLQLKERKCVQLAWMSIDADGQPNLDELNVVLKKGNVKLVAMTGLSNVLGSLPDITTVATLAHEYGALLLVDGAQLAAHARIDVQKIDCDFLAFSGHKVYGPTGIGVLYGKAKHLEAMPPFLGGGDMIASVTTDGFTAAELPRKFEAGTPPIVEAIGLAAAIGWIESVGMDAIVAHESQLLRRASDSLLAMPGVHILGTHDATKRHGCISFTVEGVHPHDLTQLLGDEGICLRAGHHCTQPLHRALGIPASVRLSVAAYNTEDDIDRCMDTLSAARKKLRG